MDYSIVNAEKRHLDELEELEKLCFSLPWTREQLAAQLPDEHHCFLVAEGEDGLLGYIGMMHVLDEGYISNVATAPSCRRCGVAKALIRTLLECAKQLELSFVTLEVRCGNAAAIRLYESFGFAPVGLRKSYYDAPKEDALLMTIVMK